MKYVFEKKKKAVSVLSVLIEDVCVCWAWEEQPCG